jgi:hypothetical protein
MGPLVLDYRGSNVWNSKSSSSLYCPWPMPSQAELDSDVLVVISWGGSFVPTRASRYVRQRLP